MILSKGQSQFWTPIWTMILTTMVSVSSAAAPPSAAEWIEKMRSQGLALSAAETAQLRANPDTLAERKLALSRKYDVVLGEIKKHRGFLRQYYHRTGSNGLAPEVITEQSLAFVETAIREALVPLWSGGKWAFQGYAARPQKEAVACGWYLQRILSAAGFNIVPLGRCQIAHLSPDREISSYAARAVPDFETWENLEEYLNQCGEGLYLLGISAGWGHMLILDQRQDGRHYVYHAGSSPEGARVSCDEAEYYLDQFMVPQHVWAVKIDGEMIRKWLQGTEIRPWSGETKEERAQ